MKLGVRYILIKFSSAKSIHREIKLNVAKKKKAFSCAEVSEELSEIINKFFSSKIN